MQDTNTMAWVFFCVGVVTGGVLSNYIKNKKKEIRSTRLPDITLPNMDIKEAWEKIKAEPTVWDHIEIYDDNFYYIIKDYSIFLSSFESIELPSPQCKLTKTGKLLTKFSSFATIMTQLPGSEEETFYALVNRPQNSFIKKKIDRKILDIASPPLVWRRKHIKDSIEKKVIECIKEKKTFLFIDIGSGSGFDSLEIERILHRVRALTNPVTWLTEYSSLNIGINTKWIENNQLLTEKLFGENHNITRLNVSAFDFFSGKMNEKIIGNYEHLIISCNGFTNFLTDNDLQKLYQSIYKFSESFNGESTILLPFAIKNKNQEYIEKKIGFQYRAEEKTELILFTKTIFNNYQLSFSEKYNQIVIVLKKKNI